MSRVLCGDMSMTTKDINLLIQSVNLVLELLTAVVKFCRRGTHLIQKCLPKILMHTLSVFLSLKIFGPNTLCVADILPVRLNLESSTAMTDKQQNFEWTAESASLRQPFSSLKHVRKQNFRFKVRLRREVMWSNVFNLFTKSGWCFPRFYHNFLNFYRS